MLETFDLAKLHKQVPSELQMTERRYASVLSSVIAWSGVNSSYWAENFNCEFLPLAERLLSEDALMDDLLNSYYRGGISQSLRRLQVRWVVMSLLVNMVLAADIREGL